MSIYSGPTFATDRLALAIAMHATGRLRFLNCTLASQNKVNFVFADPDGKSSDHEFDFSSGSLTAPVTAVFASQNFLRDQMTRTLQDRRTGHATNR